MGVTFADDTEEFGIYQKKQSKKAHMEWAFSDASVTSVTCGWQIDELGSPSEHIFPYALLT